MAPGWPYEWEPLPQAVGSHLENRGNRLAQNLFGVRCPTAVMPFKAVLSVPQQGRSHPHPFSVGEEKTKQSEQDWFQGTSEEDLAEHIIFL